LIIVSAALQDIVASVSGELIDAGSALQGVVIVTSPKPVVS
jgi:hypothetical protein